MTSTGPVVPQPVEKSVLFGTPEDRKTIIILACLGFVIAGLAYWLIAREEGSVPIPGIIFSAVNGGLLGMLLGQLILVYPDRVVVIFTLLGAFLAELIYLAGSGKLENFVFNSNTFLALLAIFFWAGWVGFWIGFVMYAKRERRRQRFQQRFDEHIEQEGEIPPEA